MPFGLKVGLLLCVLCVMCYDLSVIFLSQCHNVDDIGVWSNEWPEHLDDIRCFLNTTSEVRLTLSLKKCEFASQRRNLWDIILARAVDDSPHNIWRG